mmetsp:Transcript_16451/g.44205  ORF Transcript_16451/g.44205 Transcript_16451/m.44205 type:complete len:253 (-) Transcript_16451:286-1044(-)
MTRSMQLGRPASDDEAEAVGGALAAEATEPAARPSRAILLHSAARLARRSRRLVALPLELVVGLESSSPVMRSGDAPRRAKSSCADCPQAKRSWEPPSGAHSSNGRTSSASLPRAAATQCTRVISIASATARLSKVQAKVRRSAFRNDGFGRAMKESDGRTAKLSSTVTHCLGPLEGLLELALPSPAADGATANMQNRMTWRPTRSARSVTGIRNSDAVQSSIVNTSLLGSYRTLASVPPAPTSGAKATKAG